MKTLIVEDDKTTGKLLEALFKSKTNQIVLVADGLEALKKLEQIKFNLVISDIQMANMDGFTLILRIRNDIRFMYIPVILYSAVYTDSNFDKMALQCGANRFVRKNGSTKEIQAAVYQYTGLSLRKSQN